MISIKLAEQEHNSDWGGNKVNQSVDKFSSQQSTVTGDNDKDAKYIEWKGRKSWRQMIHSIDRQT